MENLLKAIHSLGQPEKAKLLARYFKTGKGEYGEGDKFLGIMVPQQRQVAKEFSGTLNLKEVEQLLHNQYHECRLIALLILIRIYKKANDGTKKQIVNLYLRNTAHINNWDLVDLSSRDIIGSYYFDKDRKVLFELARSPLLWDRRISIISTFYFIARRDLDDSIRLAEMLLHDKQDLIHKAVGWVLREIGKKDLQKEEEFLQKHHKEMPRTALRYAIERFTKKKREYYMKK